MCKITFSLKVRKYPPWKSQNRGYCLAKELSWCSCCLPLASTLACETGLAIVTATGLAWIFLSSPQFPHQSKRRLPPSEPSLLCCSGLSAASSWSCSLEHDHQELTTTQFCLPKPCQVSYPGNHAFSYSSLCFCVCMMCVCAGMDA